ncbi:MAG: RdgB/HAM1 family non-canonical purine NTP pyrophosphatase [Thiothrix sp.]|nr:RdgB/HAM1 family non-canonical purine NTP pyrophosphatase [Thiothrix sp.]HPQ96125.1 RdgB/HAM1 family non-canonical purine NTP pyrophosphatase [Thiolinea sp.]
MNPASLPPEMVLASSNPGKLAEFARLLQGSGLGTALLSQGSLGIGDADETGLSFVENAIIKARHAAKQSGLPALADDSGLMVDALHGAPGVYSARFAGPEADAAANNALLLWKLQEVPEPARTACFRCCIVYVRRHDDPLPLIAEAGWCGTILEEPTGGQGFGYDPLFWVPDHGCSAAQLEMAEKNRISHRGQAMARMAQLLMQL